MLKAWRKVKLSILFLYIFVTFHLYFVFLPQNAVWWGRVAGSLLVISACHSALVISGARLALSVYLACGLWWTVMGFHHIWTHTLFFFVPVAGRENLDIPETLDFPYLSFTHSFFNV